jgi:acylphosphatase
LPGESQGSRPEDAGAVRRRVVVYGHVQGVYFRDTLRRAAVRADVAGWVRNRPDGAVEAVFEGPELAVRRLIGLARAGPPGARVDHVAISEERPAGLTGFTVAG